jgi:hypothetical protein
MVSRTWLVSCLSVVILASEGLVMNAEWKGLFCDLVASRRTNQSKYERAALRLASCVTNVDDR